jgi:uncharacterized protein with WD repeat
LATATDDGAVRLWETNNLAAGPVELGGHEEPVMAVTFSPDGGWLASASLDHTAKLWDMDDLTVEPMVLSGHEKGVTAVTFSPRGDWLATASDDQTVRLYNVGDQTADVAAILRGHEGVIHAITFSPDGNGLASWSADKTARLWDISAVSKAALAPNAASITAEGRDAEVDTQTAEPVALRGHSGDVSAAAFSPDGRWLATGSDDGTVRLWTLPLDELITLACRVAGRNLTLGEWQWYLRSEYRKTCAHLPAAPAFIEERIIHAEDAYLDEGERAASLIYQEALQWVGETNDGRLHNMLCWSGSIHGAVEIVLPACERAVELEPDNGNYRRSRGVARALVEDYGGAITDLAFAVERWKRKENGWWYESEIQQHEEWIEALEAGQNPFRAETLEALRE